MGDQNRLHASLIQDCKASLILPTGLLAYYLAVNHLPKFPEEGTAYQIFSIFTLRITNKISICLNVYDLKKIAYTCVQTDNSGHKLGCRSIATESR